MKILCPYHKDTNPSMEVYEEYSHCFVCGAHISNDKLGVKNGDRAVKRITNITNITNLVEYVLTLPKKRIRGLDFHADSRGYYILWPNLQFCKRRNFDSKHRYTSPRGSKPILWKGFSEPLHNTLVVIEGEINAMTIRECCSESVDICSPGAASEFPNHPLEYAGYNNVVLVLDKDAPGVAYGVYTRDLLVKLGKKVTLILRDKDYNDVLQQSGPLKVIEEFRKDIT